MANLGEGVSGTVTVGTYQGHNVAVKRFFKGEYDVVSEDFVRETCIMRKLKYSYVMNTLHASISEEGVCEIMMPLGKTDLFKLVNDGVQFDIKSMGLKIALGLVYLENNNVFHGDIKPENIIIMEDLTPKIADFGVSVVNVCTFTFDSMWQSVNTFHYKAPEMLVGLGYDFSSFSWVFGLLMYFMSKGKNLFFPLDMKIL